MGTPLNQDLAQESVQAIGREIAASVSHALRLQVPLLDKDSTQVISAIIGTVAAEHPALRAAILYGSVARHEERPLDDLAPSDVDLLLLFTPGLTEHDLTFAEHRAIFASIGRARTSVPEPPRDVQVVPVTQSLADWDETFIGNVALDGILLFARGELPSSLASVGDRALPFSMSTPSEVDTRY